MSARHKVKVLITGGRTDDSTVRVRVRVSVSVRASVSVRVRVSFSVSVRVMHRRFNSNSTRHVNSHVISPSRAMI